MAHTLLILGLAFVVLHYASVTVINTSKDLGESVGIPHWLIAAFMLSFGTSLPEVVVTISSSIAGLPRLALGNIVGSNIANIGLAFALPWLLYGLNKYKVEKLFIIEFVFVQLLLISVTLYFKFSAIVGMLLIVFYILIIWVKILNHKEDNGINKDISKLPLVIKCLFAFIAIPFASHFVVKSAADLIGLLGISESFIGLVLIAIGTSLPECYACFVALKKKLPEIAIGNVVGSNIVNSTFVAGIIGLFSTKTASYAEFIPSFVVMSIFTLAMAGLLLFRVRHRIFAVIFAFGYLAYILHLLFSSKGQLI